MLPKRPARGNLWSSLSLGTCCFRDVPGTDGVAFYQVLDDGCSVAPYRAYLSCAHDASDNGANFAPKMRIVFHQDATTDVENVQSDNVQSTKVLRNGQVIIIRDNKEFNVLGQQL